jgi:hypothetical protein
MPTLWLFDIEPHEQRYTAEWQTYLPQQIEAAMKGIRRRQWRLQIVSSVKASGSTTKGAFLNFAETNVYKSHQVAAFATEVDKGNVKKGDRLLFTDAWHPGVIQARYMSDLLKLNLTIDLMWHAGSYDKHDLLGQMVQNKTWSYAFERALFSAADRNFFATKFHERQFMAIIHPKDTAKARIVGWPMEYLPQLLQGRANQCAKDTILFPHRISREKQPEILTGISHLLRTYRVFFAQNQPLTKQQYHDELARAVVVFSASKQETLGIGTYEGVLCGAIPIVPNRLSYREIYGSLCYPSAWTENVKSIKTYATALVAHLNNTHLYSTPAQLATLAQRVGKQYFNGSALYAEVLR